MPASLALKSKTRTNRAAGSKVGGDPKGLDDDFVGHYFGQNGTPMRMNDFNNTSATAADKAALLNDIRNQIVNKLNPIGDWTATAAGNASDITLTNKATPPKVKTATLRVQNLRPKSEGLAFAQYAVARIFELLVDTTQDKYTIEFSDLSGAGTMLTPAHQQGMFNAFSVNAGITLANMEDATKYDEPRVTLKFPNPDVHGLHFKNLEVTKPKEERAEPFFVILAFMLFTMQKYAVLQDPSNVTKGTVGGQDDINALYDTLDAALTQLSA